MEEKTPHKLIMEEKEKNFKEIGENGKEFFFGNSDSKKLQNPNGDTEIDEKVEEKSEEHGKTSCEVGRTEKRTGTQLSSMLLYENQPPTSQGLQPPRCHQQPQQT